MSVALRSALWGTGFTFLMTSLGAASVFLFRRAVSGSIQRAFLGFAAGVMIAASVWSLLIPAMEAVSDWGRLRWVPAVGGMIPGMAFLLAMDVAMSRLMRSTSRQRDALLMLAVTVHNIPEGMAVGLAFALSASGAPGLNTAAAALALGIGIQNFPEGMAISLPLRQAGCPAGRAFALGSLSGIVEPVFGVLVVLVAGTVRPLMPWLLSFAAGAMLYVVVENLIPEAVSGARAHEGTAGVMVGFMVMMLLDVALG